MNYHVCSISYKTTLPEAVMADRVRRVAQSFASSRDYQVVAGGEGERYVLQTACSQRMGFATVSPGLVQFFVYVFGEQETLAQAHVVEAEMKVLMQAEFDDSEPIPGTLLKPLRIVKDIEFPNIDEALLKMDLSEIQAGSIKLGY
jgi:hypothetical protein